MQKRFFVLPKVGQELDHVLQVSFSFDGFVDIGAAALELVAASGVLNDFSLLHALHQAVVDAERHATAVSEL